MSFRSGDENRPAAQPPICQASGLVIILLNSTAVIFPVKYPVT